MRRARQMQVEDCFEFDFGANRRIAPSTAKRLCIVKKKSEGYL